MSDNENTRMKTALENIIIQSHYCPHCQYKMKRVVGSNLDNATFYKCPKCGKIIAEEKKPNKYSSQKTVIDGITFDSKKEAHYYLFLLSEYHAGRINRIKLQPEYELQPAFQHGGKEGTKHRPIIYIADFLVIYPDGKEEVIDCKGFKTREYQIKKKLLLFKYPYINLKEM